MDSLLAAQAAARWLDAIATSDSFGNASANSPPPLAPPTPPGKIVIGIVLVVLGSLCVSVGFHFWKWSHEVEGDLPIWKRWRWWVGLVSSMLAPLGCDAASYALLPLALIAPFGALPILFSGLFAATGWFGVLEPLTRLDVLAMFIIASGVTLVSCVTVSTGVSEVTLTAYTRDVSRALFVVPASLILFFDVLWLTLHKLPSLSRRVEPHLQTTAATLFTAFLAAASSSFSQVFMKVFSESLHEWGDGSKHLFARGITWYGLLGLIASGGTNLLLLQLLLGRGRRINIAVPAYQAGRASERESERARERERCRSRVTVCKRVYLCAFVRVRAHVRVRACCAHARVRALCVGGEEGSTGEGRAAAPRRHTRAEKGPCDEHAWGGARATRQSVASCGRAQRLIAIDSPPLGARSR